MQCTNPSMIMKIPVFVYPQSITFVLEEKALHKQLITLYNPYDFSVKYRVLSTCPDKYVVVNSDGYIPSHFSIDIAIRHNDPTSINCDVTDKFRIQLLDNNTKQVLGKQDIQATLLKRVDLNSTSFSKDKFEFVESGNRYEPSLTQDIASSAQPFQNVSVPVYNRSSSPNYIALTLASICIVGLLLPTDKEDGSPTSHFHISVNMKLVFAYILGLVTIVVLKPS